MHPRLALLGLLGLALWGWLSVDGGGSVEAGEAFSPRAALTAPAQVADDLAKEPGQPMRRTQGEEAPGEVPLVLEADASEVADAVPEPEPSRLRPGLDIDALLADLRDDDVRMNAHRASRVLRGLTYHPKDRGEVRPRAEALLHSQDRQQRLFVTELLLKLEIEAAKDGESRSPNLDLVDRAFDWLDGAPSLNHYNEYLDPDYRTAVDFCLTHLEQVEWRVVDLLIRGSDQERYLCAFILGAQRRGPYADLVARELTPHLANNRIERDALESAFALKRLGPAVLPWLPLDGIDEQQSYLLDALRREIRHPGSTRSDRKRSDITERAPFGPVSAWTPRRYGRFLRDR